MKKYILLAFMVFFLTCDDGDINTINLDFEDTFTALECNGNIILYKTKSDPAESLAIVLNGLTIEDLQNITNSTEYNIDGNTVRFNYRTYSNATIDGNEVFCSNIPPSSVMIISDDESSAGTITITNVLVEEDDDGIPAEFEDINGNGDLDDDDTDMDGVPNYLDEDDDGDNVSTSNEDVDPNGDGDFSDALDTDGDGTPNYLDNDDDGDGIETRDEENISQDLNPINDISADINGVPTEDYLNPNVAVQAIDTSQFYHHEIQQTYTITIIVRDFNLSTLTQQELDFGTLSGSGSTSSRVPDLIFN